MASGEKKRIGGKVVYVRKYAGRFATGTEQQLAQAEKNLKYYIEREQATIERLSQPNAYAIGQTVQEALDEHRESLNNLRAQMRELRHEQKRRINSERANSDGNSFVSVKNGNRNETLVTEKDGEYRYQGYTPEYSKKIDTADPEYKRVLRDNNVKVKFTASGEAVVSKGGLFSRGKTFKTIDAFQTEANRRLDAIAERGRSEFDRVKSGRMVQIEAENLKSYAKDHTISDTKGHYEKQASASMKSARIQQEAALDMKRRLATVVDAAKRKAAR